MQNIFLNKILSELNYLNKVPKFQLERAISPLLGIFILDIVNKHFNTNCILSIPEFPIRPSKHKNLLDQKENFQSTNIDWLLFDKENQTLFLVEFKTDLFSLVKDQYEIYKEVQNQIAVLENASFLLNDIIRIKPRSNRSDKYQTIINKIDEHNIQFSDYKKLKIVYLIPSEKESFVLDNEDEFLFFNDLKNEIGLNEFQVEWDQLLAFLKAL